MRDTDMVWLNDLFGEIELKWERQQLRCMSPGHKGNPMVWTTFRPRKGRPFYCDECRAAWKQHVDDVAGEPAEGVAGEYPRPARG